MKRSPSQPSAIQPGVLGRLNEQAVLRTIRSHGSLSRIEVAHHLGITAPTASKAVDSLLQRGWLEEEAASSNSGVLEPGRGRPARKVNLLSDNRAQVLGAVLDAGRCRVVSAGLNGALHEEGTIAFPTPATYDELITRIAEAARQLATRKGVVTLGMGISVPGLIDYRELKGVLSPNLPITNGRSPVRDIGALVGFPCIQLQEVDALCLAERAFGAVRGQKDFAVLDVSTGVGLGIVLDGRLLAGHRGLTGELGHITVKPDGGRLCGCGNYGCLETEACDTALAHFISERLGRPMSMEEIAALVARGQLTAEAEVERCVRFLAIGIAAVLNLFNLSLLYVHGEMFTLFPDLFPRLLAETEKRTLGPSFADCRIVLTRGSKRLGAIAGILEHLIDSLVPSALRGRG